MDGRVEKREWWIWRPAQALGMNPWHIGPVPRNQPNIESVEVVSAEYTEALERERDEAVAALERVLRIVDEPDSPEGFYSQKTLERQIRAHHVARAVSTQPNPVQGDTGS